MGLWAVTYVALFVLFHKSGGKEKFMGMAIGGWIASIVYAQGGLFGNNIGGIAVFAFSFFIVILSIIAYGLVKESGE